MDVDDRLFSCCGAACEYKKLGKRSANRWLDSMVVVEGPEEDGHGNDVNGVDDDDEMGFGTTIMADLKVKTAMMKRPKVMPRRMGGHRLEGMAKMALHVLPSSIAASPQTTTKHKLHWLCFK